MKKELKFIKALVCLLAKHRRLKLLEKTPLTKEEIQELCKPLKFRTCEQISAALKLSSFLQGESSWE